MSRKKKLDEHQYTVIEKHGGTAVVGLIAFMGAIMYGKHGESSILFYTFFMALIVLLIPRITELFRSQPKTQDSQELKAMTERLENLESLVCRLDTEINVQLEKSLSSGKLVTFDAGENSQLPTSFLNITSVLESRYQILKELGRGGMGIVFQAHDKQLREQVAIKILSPILSTNSEALERMKREVSAARRVTHPNVIRIHDIFETGGLNYVSMEYFHGSNLKEVIRKNGAMSMIEGFQIAAQICDGVEAAHKQGVIHRDLKSQNIIVDAAGQLKIIDFGLASTTHAEGMTATGLIMGTPEYMAPEQVAGKKVDERADLYSIGIILYELFTGSVPFTGESAIAIGFKQIKENPVTPSERNKSISPELDQIIHKLLEKNPADRYRSVSELKKDLERIFSSEIPAAQKDSTALRQVQSTRQ